MDDDFYKPYQKLQAVEEKLAQDTLLELYIMLYKDKYKNEPIFPVDNKQYRHIRDLKKQVGDKAMSFLHAYFSMRDDWFMKQQYSLDCLLKNLNKVSMVVSRRDDTRKLQGKVRLTFSCDACWKPFELICDWNYDFLNKPVFCFECGAGAKAKKVTKDEFKQAIRVIGSAFKEVEK